MPTRPAVTPPLAALERVPSCGRRFTGPSPLVPGASSETHGCEGSRLCLRSQIYVLAAHVLAAYTDPSSAHVPSYCWHSDGPYRLGLCVQFEGSRSAQEIQKFWQNWEHPSINKQEWSGQEVSQLKAVAAKHGHLEWQKVAEELGVRTGASDTRGQRVWGFHGLRHPTAQAAPRSFRMSSSCCFQGYGPQGA